jgi:hypothetical protein
MSNSLLTTKRFVLRKSLIGKKQIIEVNFKDGKKVKYNHDVAFEIMSKNGLTKLPCWSKYNTYTATNNIPSILRDKKLV